MEAEAKEKEDDDKPVIQIGTKEFVVEADDRGLYPDTIEVDRGDVVAITFKVRKQGTYFGGLDFRSAVFTTGKVLPGEEIVVQFDFDDTFKYTSYWPDSNTKKATGTIKVK